MASMSWTIFLATNLLVFSQLSKSSLACGEKVTCINR